MPTVKFRRKVSFKGGFELLSGTTVSASGTYNFADAFAASATASFNGAVRVGTSGTVFQKIIGGTVTGCNPTLAANTLGTGSILVANAALGDLIFLTPGSMPTTIILSSACVTAASTVTASFYNGGSPSVSESAITYQYLLVRAS